MHHATRALLLVLLITSIWCWGNERKAVMETEAAAAAESEPETSSGDWLSWVTWWAVAYAVIAVIMYMVDQKRNHLKSYSYHDALLVGQHSLMYPHVIAHVMCCLQLRTLLCIVLCYLLHYHFSESIRCMLRVSEYDTEGKHVFQLSDEAFGAFTTLMGLVYSIILGQSYQYYFDRQGAIQDASFKEIANIHSLFRTVATLQSLPGLELVAQQAHCLTNYTASLLGCGWRESDALSNEYDQLFTLMGHISQSHFGANLNNAQTAVLTQGLLDAQRALHQVGEARALRVSNIQADLPPVQIQLLKLLSLVFVLSFLLLNLDHPRIEAGLFSLVCGCFMMVNDIVCDLADPFAGMWNANAAVQEVHKLHTMVTAWASDKAPQKAMF